VTNLAGSAAAAETMLTEGLEPGTRPTPVHIGFTITCTDAMVRAAQQARLLRDPGSVPNTCSSACSWPPTTPQCGDCPVSA
jgi:hypothetical protein